MTPDLPETHVSKQKHFLSSSHVSTPSFLHQFFMLITHLMSVGSPEGAVAFQKFSRKRHFCS